MTVEPGPNTSIGNGADHAAVAAAALAATITVVAWWEFGQLPFGCLFLVL